MGANIHCREAQAQARLWDAAAPWQERLGELNGRARELVVRRFRAQREPAAQEDSDGAGFEEDPGYTEAFLRCRCGRIRGLAGGFLGCGAARLCKMLDLVIGKQSVVLHAAYALFSRCYLFLSTHVRPTLENIIRALGSSFTMAEGAGCS